MATSTKDKVDENIDYYGIVGVSFEATQEEIHKAFRQKAFKIHPDRNPDVPNAEELFQQLTLAHRILTDPALKGEYDKKLESKRLLKRKYDEMDAKRKKMRDDLAQREQHAAKRQRVDHDAQLRQQMKADGEKVRQAGGYDALYKLKDRVMASRRAEHQKRTQQQASFAAYEQAQQQQTKSQTTTTSSSSSPQTEIKVKWKKDEVPAAKSKMSEQELKNIFEPLFGAVRFVVKKPKSRSAVISFETEQSARAATNYDWKQYMQGSFNFAITLH